MFDGDEIEFSVLLVSDGHEIYAVPAQRVGVRHWEVKRGFPAVKFEGLAMVAAALSIEGAKREPDPRGKRAG